MSNQNTNNQNGKKPGGVAREMLSNLYDQFPKEGQDIPKDQFVNEAFAELAAGKNKPKSKILLPGEDF
jgi:hypothetical protein